MSTMEHPELRAVEDGVVVSVHVQPGARTSGVVGRHGDALKVKVSAPPLDGRANAAVIDLLARTFGVRPAQVSILAGASSRSKQVLVEGVSYRQAEEALEQLPGPTPD